ncbi:MAG: Hfq-like protein [Blastocatellia bacterium]
MNRRNGFGSREGRLKRPSSDRPRSPRREPPRSESRRPIGEDAWPGERDDSVTGCERRYLESLMETATSLVVVLEQGDRIVGRLAWYDNACLKVRPADGSPSLLIPKTNIKYLYEES